jgi:hypothetical protein|tara:strand:- start:214 stop:474 length:261 start_codon:yes stop_codon:yes gene_type:complete
MMNDPKLPYEDLLAIVFALVLFVGLIILGSIGLTSFFSGTEEAESPVAVRDPVDHTLILVKPIPVVEQSWEFKHCTPTNKDCGRLE